MIDEETKGDPAQSASAPVNRDARPDPDVIEGEIAARETSETEPPPEPGVAETRVNLVLPPQPLRAPALVVSWAARLLGLSFPRWPPAPAIRSWPPKRTYRRT